MKKTFQILLVSILLISACNPTQTQRTKSEGTMNEIIGQAAQELTFGQPESLLGNWTADMIHRQAEIYFGKKIDFTVLDNTDLHIKSIPKGNITRGKIQELMPSENKITVLQGDGATIEKLFQTLAAKGGCPISNVRFEIHPMPSAPVASNIVIGGAPLQMGKIYTFALPDNLVNDAQLSKLKRQDFNKTLRDALIEGMGKDKGKLMDAQISGRIAIVNN